MNIYSIRKSFACLLLFITESQTMSITLHKYKLAQSSTPCALGVRDGLDMFVFDGLVKCEDCNSTDVVSIKIGTRPANSSIAFNKDCVLNIEDGVCTPRFNEHCVCEEVSDTEYSFSMVYTAKIDMSGHQIRAFVTYNGSVYPSKIRYLPLVYAAEKATLAVNGKVDTLAITNRSCYLRFGYNLNITVDLYFCVLNLINPYHLEIGTETETFNESLNGCLALTFVPTRFSFGMTLQFSYEEQNECFRTGFRQITVMGPPGSSGGCDNNAMFCVYVSIIATLMRWMDL